ncbi:MAG: thiamine pyrophosphate-dependent enzyme [Balneolales bacterium]
MSKSEKNISAQEFMNFYEALIIPRLIEEKMLNLLRQGKINKWFSGIGQEAIAVGVTKALKKEDYILPMHRNLGVFTSRNVQLYPLICQLLGKHDGYTNGRERSFHFGISEKNIVGMISHLAAMLPVASGLALSFKLSNKKNIALAFCGEGSTSEGDFHEALNLAAVWQLPVIFLIENNGYSLSTPRSQQYACKELVDKAIGYGIKGIQIDGNNILEVYDIVCRARKSILKNSKPILIEAMTFRMRGHEEASGTNYVPKILMKEWEKKDPILGLEKHILDIGIATENDLDEIKLKAKITIQDEVNLALKAEYPVFDEDKEVSRVFCPVNKVGRVDNPFNYDKKYRFIDTLSAALRHEFDNDVSYIMMGQDIGDYGGVFKVTEGFIKKYGENRIRNTPIIESGILGTALGLALEGYKPVIEIQFADFITCGFNQIVNNIAKSHYRWSPPLNITIRAPHGAGVSAGPFHSQSPEGWFMQHAGLKIVVPATVEDAFALTIASLRDPNPVLIFEHKKLYRSLSTRINGQISIEALGKAKIRKTGIDATIVTYGMGVHWAMDIASKYEAEKNIIIEVVDLRTLCPLDIETVKNSIKKTGRVLLLQEASEVLGPMSEISSQIADSCFELLDAPVMRCSSLMIPIPTNKALEDGYLASHRLEKTLDRLLAY